ncbi:MAG: AAA family ATPase [Byssovorax sp.]
MRIDSLTIRNFKGIEERVFDLPLPVGAPNDSGSFHLLIGENGSGKTTTLDALAVALGIWHVAAPAAGWRSINPSDVRLIEHRYGDTTRFDPAPFSEIEARGVIAGSNVTWKRMIRKGGKKTTNSGAKEALRLVKSVTSYPAPGHAATLPLLAYYGTGRAWLPAHQREAKKRPKMTKRSRFDVPFCWMDGRINDAEVNEWFMWEKLAAAENGQERAGYVAVEQAVLSCLPEGRSLRFDVDRKELIVTMGSSSMPFYSLSDGQRVMAAMVADLAIKSVLLNPHLGKESALRSPGVVLIDELDLHLHPKWQRHVVEDLRRTFPAIQFVATTHSPFIVQTLRPGELVPLDGQPLVDEYGKLGIESIAKLMGVERPDASPRYQDMVESARDYLVTLEEAALAPEEKLAAYEEALAAKRAPYADNPAFQAFLELKHEVKLGARRSGGQKSAKG